MRRLLGNSCDILQMEPRSQVLSSWVGAGDEATVDVNDENHMIAKTNNIYLVGMWAASLIPRPVWKNHDGYGNETSGQHE